MPELITIEEAARITGFPSEDIQYWAKSHKIGRASCRERV